MLPKSNKIDINTLKNKQIVPKCAKWLEMLEKSYILTFYIQTLNSESLNYFAVRSWVEKLKDFPKFANMKSHVKKPSNFTSEKVLLQYVFYIRC